MADEEDPSAGAKKAAAEDRAAGAKTVAADEDVCDQEMCAALEEQATAGRKGKRSNSSYPQPPSMDYLDSRSATASILRHKLKLRCAAAAIASPPVPSTPTHDPHSRKSPVKRQRVSTPDELDGI